jgi:uncharacterized protein (TIGR02646 family)
VIRLTRERSSAAIHKNFVGKKRVKWNLELLTVQRDGGAHEFGKKSSRWKAAKDQLLRESNNKCAYCDTPTRVVAFGDVEHFRPKSKYWWLAYCYENYLASCTVCNQFFKSDKFPIAGTTIKGPSVTRRTSDDKLAKMAPFINPDPLNQAEGQAWEEFSRAHATEAPLIVNPYLDDPSKYIAYKVDDNLGEVELEIATGVKYRDRMRDAMNEVYGLNRLELKQLRYQWYATYAVHRHTLQDTGISAATRAETENQIKAMSSDKSPWAGMIRYFEAA